MQESKSDMLVNYSNWKWRLFWLFAKRKWIIIHNAAGLKGLQIKCHKDLRRPKEEMKKVTAAVKNESIQVIINIPTAPY